jgi:hypothetical protein
MQHNAKVAGILSIVAGTFGFLYLVGSIFMTVMFKAMMRNPYYGAPAPPDEFFTMVTVMYIGFGSFFALIGILAIIGGIFALNKKVWGLALAGSIAGTVVFFPCGIPAIIYVSMAKPEFSGQTPATGNTSSSMSA